MSGFEVGEFDRVVFRMGPEDLLRPGVDVQVLGGEFRLRLDQAFDVDAVQARALDSTLERNRNLYCSA